jgi:choline dehydrogenase
MPDPTLALGDKQLLRILLRAFLEVQVYNAAPGDKPEAPGAEAAPDDKQVRRALEGAAHLLLDAIKQGSRRLSDSTNDTHAVLEKKVEQLKQDAGRKKDVGELLNFYAEQLEDFELFRLAFAQLDPNRWFEHDKDRVGAYNTPASILQGVRTGVRERIQGVRALYPDRLDLLTGALVTRVVIENGQAVGVRYLQQERLYQATPPGQRAAPPPASEEREIRVRPRGEVILAGGAFNTPQLLMLSGVGEADHLREMGIGVRCHLPGVGQNLQDRYEVTLVTELEKEFTVLKDLTFRAPGERGVPGESAEADRGLQEWMNHRGVYATNGVVLTIIKRSRQAEDDIPDLFIFGLPGYFRGYYKGYSEDTQSAVRDNQRVESHHWFTWAILKGRTRNRKGYVRLRSKDPLARPEINFRYFDEGSVGWEKDLGALVEGIRFVRRIMNNTGLKGTVRVPTPEVLQDRSNKKLREHIKQESWGHHACGTCQIGTDNDENAVLDGDFRVRGVRNLRVVDASVFPRIPGFFIVTSIYLISEKAADVILADRGLTEPRLWPRPAVRQPTE